MQFIEPAAAHTKLNKGGVMLVDIRSDDEFKDGHIPGAVLLPDGKIDAATAQLLIPGETIFYCASGQRTRANAPAFSAAGFDHAICITGGLHAWRAAGLPVNNNNDTRTTISLPRQVQLTVGILLIALTIAAVLLSPLFVIGAGLIGTGLVIAGWTGSCTMARGLMAMPWNRVRTINQTGGNHAHG